MIKFVYEYTMIFESGMIVTGTYCKKQKNSSLIQEFKSDGKITKITMKTVAVNENETHPHKYHTINRRKSKKSWNKAVKNGRVWIMY